MPFAPHSRLTILATFRTVAAQPALEICEPGLSLDIQRLATDAELTAIDTELAAVWQALEIIPSNCYYGGFKLTRVAADGSNAAPPQYFNHGSQVGGSLNGTNPWYQAFVATLEAEGGAAPLVDRRGRMYWPSTTSMQQNGHELPAAVNSVLTRTVALINELNGIFGAGTVCTASFKRGTNYPITAVSCDDVPDTMRTRIKQLKRNRTRLALQ